jgi:type I restriction-modification system DNA methylase subunit
MKCDEISAKMGQGYGAVYTVQKNDGTCLFIQHCLYNLATNGVLCIILPDGQMFSGKNFANFREWISRNYRILKII